MDLQLLVDIGLFLLYCALFTLLLAWAWKFWMLYINTAYEKSLKYTLLEIKLPREIMKTPEAAEIFLSIVYDGGGLGAGIKEHWKGAIPAVTSLEIVSLEGIIHFYIRAQSKFRERIEAGIYSQYPNVEIVECIHDYVDDLPEIDRHNKAGHGFWGSDWQLSREGGIKEYGDKDKLVELKYSGDMYPIKTYRDWSLDSDNKKEELKDDPLAYLLEQFGAIGQGEYFCHQILIRDAGKWNKIYEIKKEKDKKVIGTEKDKELKDLAKLEIEKYRKKWTLKEKGKGEEDEWGRAKGKSIKDKEGNEKFVEDVYAKNLIKQEKISPEKEEQFQIEQIERKMSSFQVITQMRTIYVANSGEHLGTRIPMLGTIVKPFSTPKFNQFSPDMSTFPDPYDYPWQDPGKMFSAWRKENLFQDYISRDGLISFSSGVGEKTKKMLDRTMFNRSNYVRTRFTILHNILLHPFAPTRILSGFTLSLEELATLFHFPGKVAETPTLPRVNSLKGSAPSNLPRE